VFRQISTKEMALSIIYFSFMSFLHFKTSLLNLSLKGMVAVAIVQLDYVANAWVYLVEGERHFVVHSHDYATASNPSVMHEWRSTSFLCEFS
jgi:hypothetical protein